MVVGAIAAVVALSAVDLVVVASRCGASAQTTASGSTAEAAPRVAVLSPIPWNAMPDGPWQTEVVVSRLPPIMSAIETATRCASQVVSDSP